jgi:hypothetical protein
MVVQLAVSSVMSAEAKKYHGYARECTRLAGEANTLEKRNKLLDLARVWRDAALTEERALGVQRDNIAVVDANA